MFRCLRKLESTGHWNSFNWYLYLKGISPNPSLKKRGNLLLNNRILDVNSLL
jgi:hypothetical protein